MNQLARTPKQLGTTIRRRRKALQLTQTTLGEKSGLRQATISAVEDGEPGTELKTLFDILAALDLELVVRPRSKGNASEIEKLF